MGSSHISINLWEPRAVRRLPQCRRESWPPGECAHKAQSTRRAGLPWAALPEEAAGVMVPTRPSEPGGFFPRPRRELLVVVLLGPLAAHHAAPSPARGPKSPFPTENKAARSQFQCLKSLLSGNCPLCFPEKVRSLSPRATY